MATVSEQQRFAASELRRPTLAAGSEAASWHFAPAQPPVADARGNVEELLHGTRRRKVWELAETFHCSIVGTCLSPGALRQLLVKLAIAGAETASDHDLHGWAVLLARNRDAGGKLLNKALDRRHHLAINQFTRARSEARVGELWTEAVRRGDIPGAYWAVLTHPAASDALLRKVFGEVHMLSHLIGAANRADIRRLHQLEQENGELLAKVARQQAQLRNAVITRDAKIRELAAALTCRVAAEALADASNESSGREAGLITLVAALERRLAAETRRRERAERRLEQGGAARIEAEETCRLVLSERDTLRAELTIAEKSLTSLVEGRERASALDLRGISLLYIGGRQSQVSQLRALAVRASAHFLHHDGGIDERSGTLPGLISRADVALFPVDCVSHEAAILVKRLCRQLGKPWLPLRTASITAFLAAIDQIAAARDAHHPPS